MHSRRRRCDLIISGPSARQPEILRRRSERYRAYQGRLSQYGGVPKVVRKCAIRARTLAPTGSERPFALAQGLVFAFYLVTGALAMKGFRRATLRL